MGKIVVDMDRGTVVSKTASVVIARVQVIPDGHQDKETSIPGKFTESIILIDNSGSMAGEKLESAKQAAIQYYKLLNSGDRITVAAFSSKCKILVDGMPVSADKMPKSKDSIEGIINGMTADDGTYMYEALQKIYNLIVSKFDSKTPPSYKLILLTDGEATDGLPEEFKEIAILFSKAGVPMYIIGIGDDYDEDLLLDMYRANEIGFFYHLTNVGDLIKQFESISKEVILYPSREMNIKLTTGTRLIKVYKYEPQVLELDPKKIAENIYSIPLGNIGKETQKILVQMEVPARQSGEFREASFSVELDSIVSDNLIIKRSDDLNLVKQSFNPDIKAEFSDAEMKTLGLKALDKNNPDAEKAKQIFTQKLNRLKNDQDMTQKLGTEKINQYETVKDIALGTKKVSETEIKETKALFTKRRETK